MNFSKKNHELKKRNRNVVSKKLFTILLAFMLTASYSQNFPTVKLEDKSNLKLNKLHVNVEITGNYATVTYDMTFYNGLNRILEGELAFPLAQGQSVSHFAMDLNSKLRSAVVVEKELGRVAYENTIKQRIDPALLEQTQGNNYKARVYPIPAKGYKRIVITYEQNLMVNDDNYQFAIPFGFKTLLSDFKIEIKCNSLDIPPIVSDGFFKDLKFIKSANNVTAKYEADVVNLNRDLKITIPIKDVFSIQTVDEYFHINKAFMPKKRMKAMPNSITMLWDASYSMQYKKLEDELSLISNYMKYIRNVKVNLIVFSNTVINNRIFRIKNGNCDELINVLRAVRYDGGTSYKKLSITKSDEILLFSDGLHNLGGLDLNEKGKLYCINSTRSSNHQLLDVLASEKGGNYINLNSVSNSSALSLLKHEVFQFLGVKHNNILFEVYPKPKTVVNENFNLSGKYVEAKPVELLFGYDEEITERITVDMSSSSNSETAKRLWAKNKLKYLVKNKELHKNEIIELAKAYHLISPYTSMIVLDRIEDYVHYKIEPPSELKEKYNRRLSESKLQQQHLLEDLIDRKEDLQSDYLNIREWYNKDFVVKPKEKEKKIRTIKSNSVTNSNQTTNSQTTIVNNNQAQPENSRPIDRNINITEAFVSGTLIASNDGLPLPGASVVIKGTTKGVQTDFDGNFAINASPDEILVFSYVGFINREYRLNSSTTKLNVTLSEDSSTLDEVVVIGYGTTTKKAYTASVTAVKAEIIESKNFENVSQSLTGEAAGVTVINSSGQPSSANTIRIRGFGSINGNYTPLYIVDGLPMTGDLGNINPNDIKSTTILKDNTATAIYGSRGANGVVLITTKSGSESSKKDIKVLNEKIVEQLALKPWDKNASYMEYIREQKSVEDAYSAYLKIRKNYRNTPSFFLDIADFFESKKRIDIALRIATNLIEIELDNHELIRALAYKLEQYKKFDLAIYVYKAVLELRPEHPQSYRDLALAYEANGDFDAAIELFLKIINGDLLEKDEEEMYYGIEQIAYVELCHLVNSTKGKRFKELKEKYKSIEIDIRVLVDWNHGETDLDLYIKNPAAEIVYYGHDTSKYGGRLSVDMTEGYGPESFWIKKAQKGDYEISVDYYSDRVQKITGPASLKVTIYRNYGKSNEEKEIKVLRLSDNDSKREIESITI